MLAPGAGIAVSPLRRATEVYCGTAYPAQKAAAATAAAAEVEFVAHRGAIYRGKPATSAGR